MAKMTYDETLQAFNDERCIESTDVQTCAVGFTFPVNRRGRSDQAARPQSAQPDSASQCPLWRAHGPAGLASR
jgi:hypothetical protein